MLLNCFGFVFVFAVYKLKIIVLDFKSSFSLLFRLHYCVVYVCMLLPLNQSFTQKKKTFLFPIKITSCETKHISKQNSVPSLLPSIHPSTHPTHTHAYIHHIHIQYTHIYKPVFVTLLLNDDVKCP